MKERRRLGGEAEDLLFDFFSPFFSFFWAGARPRCAGSTFTLLTFLYLVFTLFSFFGQVRDHDVRAVLRGVAECILHRHTFLKVLYSDFI